MSLRLGSDWFGRIMPKVIMGIVAFVFLVSMLNPFLSGVLWPPEGLTGSRLYVEGEVWSFKGTLKMRIWVGPWGNLNFSVSQAERWFTDYWVLGRIPNDQSYHWGLLYWGVFGVSVSLFVFVGQIMTLLSTASCLLVRRVTLPWLLAAALCGLFTILSMEVFRLEIYNKTSFEAGFWLSVASDILLFAVLIASLMWNQRR
jgi:hypothetical protein